MKTIILNENIVSNIYEAYHSLNTKFTKFKLIQNDDLNLISLYGNGIYFTDNLNYSKKFGNITYKCKIIFKKPLNLTNEVSKSELIKLYNEIESLEKRDEDLLTIIKKGLNTTAFKIIRKYIPFEKLKTMYDGVIGDCEEGGYEYIVYNLKNIQIIETM